jgi:hypothetical protein
MHERPTHRFAPLRSAALAATAVALAASLAWSDPEVRVSYPGGVTRIELEGSWAQSQYRVSRAATPEGPATPITALDTPCLGPCFADDPAAEPGRTYWYRFDLVLADGTAARFGPYPVTVSPALSASVGLGVFPNPGRGLQRIELFVTGRPSDPAVAGRLEVLDVSGRRVRALLVGPVSRGATRLYWDGTDASGRRVPPGAYLMHFATSLGARTARLLRIDS